MKPITQTDDALVINTPQFGLTVPGVWLEESPSSDHVIYSGLSSDDEIQKQIIVAGYLLAPGGVEKQRRLAFERLLAIRLAMEREVTQGDIRIVEDPIQEIGNLLLGSYSGVHSAARRIVFSCLLCDHEKAFNVYHAQWHASDFPDLQKVSDDFDEILSTAELK